MLRFQVLPPTTKTIPGYNKADVPKNVGFKKLSWRWDLNPQPTVYKTVALPIAPLQHTLQTNSLILRAAFRTMMNATTQMGFHSSRAVSTDYSLPLQEGSYLSNLLIVRYKDSLRVRGFVVSLLDKLRSWNSSSGRLATIDTVKAAPPPSPLAPIDLTDPAQVAAVMDLAARIGDILLSAGTSNRDTRAQVHAVTAAYGLLFCHVDITLNTITVFTTIGTTKKTPVSVFRVVRSLTTDFSKLTEVDRLIRSIQAGATPPDVAEKILNELSQTRAKYRFRTAVFGWGFLGAAVSMLLGGTFLVAAISFVVALVIIGGSVWLDRNSLPLFFQYIFGGFMATVPAAVAYSVASHYGIHISPSHIVAAGIVVMMSNLAMVQSLQDGITGAPVTASARFFETLLLTGAIVAGVGAGIQVVQFMGITLPPLEAAVSLAAKLPFLRSLPERWHRQPLPWGVLPSSLRLRFLVLLPQRAPLCSTTCLFLWALALWYQSLPPQLLLALRVVYSPAGF